MTTRPTKKSPKPAAKTATKSDTKAHKSGPAKSPGEQVIRHELLGACHIALPRGTHTAIGKKAADALVAALKGVYATCTVQCEGYVFNLFMVPLLALDPDPQAKASKGGS